MLQVELDHILSQDDAAGRIRDIITDVEDSGEIYVVTKDGQPAVAIVSVNQLEMGLDTPKIAEQAKAEAAEAMPDTEPEAQPDLPPLPEPMPAPMDDAPTLPEPPTAPMPTPPSAPAAWTPAPPITSPDMPAAPLPTADDASPMSEPLDENPPAVPAFTPIANPAGSDLPPLSGTEALDTPAAPAPAALPDMPA